MPDLLPLILVLTLGCAALRPPVAQPGSGPPLYVVREAICRTDPGAVTRPSAVSDRDLCRELIPAFELALRETGYRVVDRPDVPHAANVRLFGQQHAIDDSTDCLLTVQSVVESMGGEVERAVEEAVLSEPSKRKDHLAVLARSIALALAQSPRMRRDGLVPRWEKPH